MKLNEFQLLTSQMLVAEKLDNNDTQNNFVTSIRVDNRESKDNLFYFKVVKLPDNKTVLSETGFTLAIGDMIISQSLGTPIWFEDVTNECRMFELKYIIGKVLV